MSECAETTLSMIAKNDYDLLITDQSIPGMQGSELAQRVRALGPKEMVIIAITVDIYALEYRYQFLAAGMNGVLIKPLSLMSLENELLRYFQSERVTEENGSFPDKYHFDAFSNLIKENSANTSIILSEIKRVHDETLLILDRELVNESTLASPLHKVKGGAQLLNTKRFIQACESLETECDLERKTVALKELLEEQKEELVLSSLRFILL